MVHIELVTLTIALTIGSYALSRRAFLKYGYAVLSPVFFSTLVIMTTLGLLKIPFEHYQPGKHVMTALLGPAVVELALPLYRQGRVLLRYLPVVLAGVISGSLVSLVTAVAVARMAGLDTVTVVSIAPKSVTAPIAVEIVTLLGGDPALTAAFVIATGTLGSMIGPWFLSRLGVHDPFTRGLAVGTAAHGQGTAMMLQEGEVQGALSGIAMAIAAIFVSLVAPLMIPWIVKLGQ